MVSISQVNVEFDLLAGLPCDLVWQGPTCQSVVLYM